MVTSDFAALVQRQLDAYNAHDADGFAACFSDGVQCFRHPDTQPFLQGRAALRDYYARERFSIDGLHARLVHRIDFGRRVLDHEHVMGLDPSPREVVAVYEQGDDGLIAAVSFIAPL